MATICFAGDGERCKHRRRVTCTHSAVHSLHPSLWVPPVQVARCQGSMLRTDVPLQDGWSHVHPMYRRTYNHLSYACLHDTPKGAAPSSSPSACPVYDQPWIPQLPPSPPPSSPQSSLMRLLGSPHPVMHPPPPPCTTQRAPSPLPFWVPLAGPGTRPHSTSSTSRRAAGRG